MIWFTEITGSDTEGREIIFQFFDRELPDSVTFPKTAILNKVQFPGGHQSNQIIGVYRDEVEWSGTMFGMYTEYGDNKTARDRGNDLQALVGKIVRVGFPVPDGEMQMPGNTTKGVGAGPKKKDKDYDNNGFKGVYIVENVTLTVKNYLNVEYSIKLVPHERQEKVKPSKTTDVRVKVITANLNTTGLSNAVGSTKAKPVSDKGPQNAANNKKTTEKIAPKPSWDRSTDKIKNRKKG